MSATEYGPGSLVRARGREWIVLTGSDADTIRVRPVSGSEGDATRIHLGLEAEPVTEAKFPPPAPTQRAGHDAAHLLRDALVLSLRRGAGPFRGFGQIAVEPRAYQLVPLLMALKLDPVRLLIADDVGIGKTIEAGLIARELLDRGDIDRTLVLCPPHLVEQWVAELEDRFHIHAVPVTAASAGRLERDLPVSESIFSAHQHTVVSLDYIKSDRRRDEFLRACPDFVIVDEAHTCAAAGRGRHQRYQLLRGLADAPQRHLTFLTATPHSGDEAAFFRLLGLLDRDFEALAGLTGDDRQGLRERLSLHFVQRRRVDIEDWETKRLFPLRERKELTYRLTGTWEKFFEDVLDYCVAVVSSAGDDARRERLSFWSTLALMRCVASSPAAAAQALRTRADLSPDEAADQALADHVFDGDAAALLDDDIEPAGAPPDTPDAPTRNSALTALVHQAEKLTGRAGDPKLKLVSDHVNDLVEAGFSPVVFCRYIATAHYVARHLRKALKDVTIAVVTGELTPDERREKVEGLADADRRLLVATDCLSEGINLQDHLDAVVHYDLSWNPTRHEQREGRVDRFGQKSDKVRATLVYGANNPVDGAVLEVILRKAEKIRKELGVPVPLPDDEHTLTQALLRAVFLRRRAPSTQFELDLGSTPEARAIDAGWQDAATRTRLNRTVFAQRRLKPDDVLPEWRKSLAALGGADDVQRFADRALARLGAGLEPLARPGAANRSGRGYKAPLDALPDDIRERLAAEGLTGTSLVDFTYPPAARCQAVQRSHPLVAVLAETLLERTLAREPDDPDSDGDPGVLGRTGCWVTNGVENMTTVVLLRLRHQLTTQREGRTTTVLVEEAGALALQGALRAQSDSTTSSLLEGEDALALLAHPPVADPPAHVRDRAVSQALTWLDERSGDLADFAQRRAQALLADHRRVREAAQARGSYSVRALVPADVIGVFILLPQVG